jgi:predicted pyridoxine 5'-phosphate oxidase superfamily flavin-nucleotide-binding protein
MKISDAVKKCLQAESKANLLATSDKSGKVNVAMFGSYQLMDDSSVLVMLGDNRSFSNLKENPQAACIVMLHGKTGMATEGCRLYMKVRTIQDEGEKFNEVKEKIRARIGGGADILMHLVLFDIVEARPILDFGQGI